MSRRGLDDRSEIRMNQGGSRARLSTVLPWVMARDEQVVLHRHPHWKRLIGAVLVLLFTSAAAAFVAGYVNTLAWDASAKNVIFLVIGGIWLVLVGWLTLWPFLNWWTTHFVITDRRVMFRHDLVTRILRTGTLVIESAAQDPLEFHDIPRVEHVHSLLYHEVFDTLGSDESPS